MEQLRIDSDTPSSTGKLQQILREQFGLSSFRKGQLSVLESVLAKNDTMAVMPTGGGKSLCYQIPAIYFEGLVIVISPLIALMKDQVASLQKVKVASGSIHSSQTADEKREVFRQMKLNKSFVLYLSPERAQNPGFTEWVKTQNVVLIAIDEAHCVSQWGSDFRPDYAKLKILRQLKPNVPILALTATATPRVLTDIEKQLCLKEPKRHVYGFYRPNLFYQIETCTNDEQKIGFLKEALRQTPTGRILIYCGTRKGCEDLAIELQREFQKVGFYHAGMASEEREKIQEQLDRDELRILVATNAFGMGIDYPDVRLVAHMQAPANIESLYQEMGRAGRDGKMSRCLLLYAKKDKSLHSFFINKSDAEPMVINQRWRALDTLVEFVDSSECRHGGILTYFRDSERIETCGHCDICAPLSEWIVKKPESLFVKKSTTKRVRKVKSGQQFSISDPAAEARALLLKDWRRQFSKERDVPAFIIFSDRTLTDLANKNPTCVEELEGIYGLGPSKIELFGQALINELTGKGTSL